jgi:hypothetical protein
MYGVLMYKKIFFCFTINIDFQDITTINTSKIHLKPVPHTIDARNRTYLATQAASDATWASSGRFTKQSHQAEPHPRYHGAPQD